MNNIIYSLRFKLIVFSILIEIIMLSVLIFNANRLISYHLTSETYKQVEIIKSNFQASILPLLIERDYASLDALLLEYTNSKNIVYIFILNNKKILSNSNWTNENEIPIEDKNIETSKKIFNSQIDIKYAGQIFGTVYFGLNTEFLEKAQEELFSQSLIIALIEILLTIILSLSIGYYLTKHLITLTEAARKIALNNLDIKIDIKSNDELGLLARAFNTMIEKIKEQFLTIRNQNELKKAIFHNMSHAIIATNEIGIITMINKKAEHLLGYNEQELIGKTTPEIFFEKEDMKEKAKIFSKELNEIIKPNFNLFIIKTLKGLPNQNSWKLISKDGKKLIVNLNVTSLIDENENIYGFIGVIEDITEKYDLEVALKEETHRLKSILECAGDCIHILDKEGNLVLYSSSFIESLGYTQDEAKYLNVQDWDKNFNIKESLSNLLISHSTFEAIHTKKDGTNFFVEIKTNGITLDGQEYLYAASRDITERKLTQNQLLKKDTIIEQQTKLVSMGEMIGNIAHQWRQPLSIITTNASSLKVKSEFGLDIDHEELKNVCDSIVTQAQYLSNTIDDFRNFIKEDKEYSNILISEILKKTISLVGSSLKNNFINLILDIKDDLEIFGNKNELEQALINIINNSKDALVENQNDGHRYVFIYTKKLSQDELQLEILDNAGGIAQNIINRVFEPYFTTKHQSVGTGIGLSMAYKIIKERHEQNIEVSNKEFIFENKDFKGASFIILFSKKI